MSGTKKSTNTKATKKTNTPAKEALEKAKAKLTSDEISAQQASELSGVADNVSVPKNQKEELNKLRQYVPGSSYKDHDLTLIKDHYKPNEVVEFIDALTGTKANMANLIVAIRNHVRRTRIAYGINDNHHMAIFTAQSRKHLPQAIKELIDKGWQVVADSKQFVSLVYGLTYNIPLGSLNIDIGKDRVVLMGIGEPEVLDGVCDVFDQFMVEEVNNYQYITGGSGGLNITNVELTAGRFPPPMDVFYPWLPQTGCTGINEFIDKYLNSEESVLFLIGPPGQGKSTILYELAKRATSRVGVCCDTDLLKSNPSSLIEYVSNRAEEDGEYTLIVEDADPLISTTREEGNTSVSALLATSDGFAPASKGKVKLIFTSNILDINNVDTALLRSGRCYAAIYLDYYNLEEAQAVAEALKSNWKPSDNGPHRYTLASIAHYRKDRRIDKETACVGFVSARPLAKSMGELKRGSSSKTTTKKRTTRKTTSKTKE